MIDVKLILGDCLEVMKDIPDKSIDAVITDPPYGVKYSPRQNSSKSWALKKFTGNIVVYGDDVKFDPSLFLCFPTVVFCGGNHFADKLPASSEWIIWDKRDGMTSNDFADCEMIWTNKSGVARIFRHLWNGAIRASEQGIERVHPTQKPIALMKWILERYTKKSETIFDPFMGSGTTGVACVQTGRNFIGIEKDPDYFAIAEKRIKEAQMQPSLFD